MPLIPVTFLFSLLCCGLLLRLGRPSARRWVFQLLLLLCAWQSLLVGLRYGYDLTQFNWLQPIGAVMIPVLVWLTFRMSMQGRLRLADVWHLTPLCLTLLASRYAPFWLDALIIVADAGYGVALWYALRGGENSLKQVALAESWLCCRLWRGLAILLFTVAIAELIITLDFAWFGGRHAGLLVTVDTFLLTLGVYLVLSRTRPAEQPVEETPEPVKAGVVNDDLIHHWFVQVQQRLLKDDLYLQPELNLALLARKSGLPARRVSQAINQYAGMNVSQYVNQLRIREAARRLLVGDRPITEIMHESGFTTKSNFNREFLRVYGTNPSEWRRQQTLS
ncbi:AraC family transcriptional regulator [Serratia marcescens]|uniref:helix-turn-helix domain-containing protein n=1 Tax=Serratia marcescens TaxID=615 RepID=UPI00192BF847|nr:helix-turn-helix domain-containing protein [Serratia marcescens]MBL5824381.1 AraC family transcriptional regulator [Serratia marcescens]